MKIDLIQSDSPFIVAINAKNANRLMPINNGALEQNAAYELLDSVDLLTVLANHCFWASIHLEEGRSVRGTLCICSRDQAPNSRAFDGAKPLSVKNIVALLTASPMSTLAIQSSTTSPKEVEIWGILDSDLRGWPIFRIAAAGTVVVSDSGNVLAILERGEVILPETADKSSFSRMVAKALGDAESFSERLHKASLIQKVVVEIHRQGHGGALVMVPASDETWKADIELTFKFEASSSQAVPARLKELTEAQGLSDESKSSQNQVGGSEMSELRSFAVTAHQGLLNSLLSSIGAHSAIDGAVVMDTSLRVLGFGAKLNANPPEPFDVTVIDCLSGGKSDKNLKDLGGTRHQSAARFVQKHDEAMIFVASQDGRLTLFAWLIAENNVCAVRQLEHLVWDYSNLIGE